MAGQGLATGADPPDRAKGNAECAAGLQRVYGLTHAGGLARLAALRGSVNPRAPAFSGTLSFGRDRSSYDSRAGGGILHAGFRPALRDSHGPGSHRIRHSLCRAFESDQGSPAI